MADQKILTVLDEVRYWTTLGGAIFTVWKVYTYLRDHVNKWADTLLNNHLTHVQDSLENIDKAQAEQIELLRKIADK